MDVKKLSCAVSRTTERREKKKERRKKTVKSKERKYQIKKTILIFLSLITHLISILILLVFVEISSRVIKSF